MEFVLRALRELDDVDVVLRPHPVDRAGIAESVARQVGGARVSSEGDMSEALERADLVVTMASTTGIEAILRAKPLILADPAGADSLVSYAREGAALLASNREELTAAARGLLYDPAVRAELAPGQERFRQRYAAGADGHAADRVAEVILAAARGKA